MFFNLLPLFKMMGPCKQGVDPELAFTLDLVALQMSAAAEAIAQTFPQVRVLDFYTLGAVSLRQGGRERSLQFVLLYSSRELRCFCFTLFYFPGGYCHTSGLSIGAACLVASD